MAYPPSVTVSDVKLRIMITSTMNAIIISMISSYMYERFTYTVCSFCPFNVSAWCMVGLYKLVR